MSLILIASLLAGAAVAQTVPPPVELFRRTPGPHASAVPASPPQQQLGRWLMSPVLCAGAAGSDVTAQPLVRAPDPQRFLGWSGTTPRRTLTVDFRIDRDGRPLSIARRGTGEYVYVPDAEDVLPALAASRFAPGIARDRCTATFTADLTPIAAAPIDDVMAYSVFPSRAPVRAIWDRLRPPGSTCTDPAPDVLLRAFPAFKAMPDQPGYRTWSMTGYDLDAAGKPRNVRTVAGSGAASLDLGARDAVARSRFERGARVGCLYPYFKGPAILPAPVPPEEDAVRPARATCPQHHGWNRAPVLVYPTTYQRRSIEGWAMIAYDVAPWGQTGNVRVLQAEPSAEFGDAAMAMIRNATLPSSDTGYTGCVDRVRYVIRKPGTPSVTPEIDAPD
ncbi:energy transducer TonB [Sphingomonas sp. RP10(2022)]|uniref:Energy transducer TonB n=1 Tax=Sphingomonas liriopis TaxID=2949094 RepID=A0A9X2HTW1_9SPHN|nr:energy transducer TonB [Sphingomonas liriopis]MCP3733398.1 energy transducer TonB [Sphingomonas liriopis]